MDQIPVETIGNLKNIFERQCHRQNDVLVCFTYGILEARYGQSSVGISVLKKSCEDNMADACSELALLLPKEESGKYVKKSCNLFAIDCGRIFSIMHEFLDDVTEIENMLNKVCFKGLQQVHDSLAAANCFYYGVYLTEVKRFKESFLVLQRNCAKNDSRSCLHYAQKMYSQEEKYLAIMTLGSICTSQDMDVHALDILSNAEVCRSTANQTDVTLAKEFFTFDEKMGVLYLEKTSSNQN